MGKSEVMQTAQAVVLRMALKQDSPKGSALATPSTQENEMWYRVEL